MKKLKRLGVLLLLIFVVLPVCVKAENIEVNDEDSLRSCVETTNNICKVIEDIELAEVIEINDGMDVVIDLNGKSIVAKSGLAVGSGLIIVHNGAKLTIEDSIGTGKISTNGTESFAAVSVTKKLDDATKTSVLVVNGGTLEGYYYGITGNGTRPNTEITINGGIIKNITNDGCGIYNPQNGKLFINGGTITGATGVEIRAGELKMTGGTVIGSTKPINITANGNGTTTVGAGIAIVQHTTKLPLNVEITGGTIKGFNALYENNIQNNDVESIKKVTMSVTGGTFETINDGTLAVYSQNITKFITGGNFSKNVEDYIADNYVSKLLNENYKVAKEHNIAVTSVDNGTVTVDKTKAIAGETVSIVATAKTDYEFKSLSVIDDITKESIAITDGKFIMPDNAVTISAEFTKIVKKVDIPIIDPTTKVEEPTITVKDTKSIENILLDSLSKNTELAELAKEQSVNVNIDVKTIDESTINKKVVETIKEKVGKGVIASYFDISVVVKKATNGDKLGNLKELSSEVELMILLPEDLKIDNKEIDRKFYVVREHDDKIELIEAKLSDDGKYLVFKSDKFSTYALAYEDIKVTPTIEKTTTQTIIPNPQTLDSILSYILLLVVSSTGIILTKKHLKANK